MHSDGAPNNCAMTELAPPQLQFFADLAVQVAKPQELGRTARGLRRLIPILGGEAVGDRWRAACFPAGPTSSWSPTRWLSSMRAAVADLLSLQPGFRDRAASLHWIAERMFVGTGARHPDKVVMRFWQLA